MERSSRLFGMENPALSAEIEVLELGCDPRVRAAARQLVASKYSLDSLCWSESGRWIVNRTCHQLLNMAHSAVVPQGFVNAVLPFAGPAGDERPALVPVDAMIGESWRWRECAPGGRSEEDLEQYLLHPRRAFKDEEEASRITLIPELGVGYATEGKNRILFLRARAVDLMPSSVAIARYPAADRLLMIDHQCEGVARAFCVLDGRWIRPLPLPELSRSMLSAYGVPITSQWPGGWPSAELIVRTIKEAEQGAGVLLHPIDVQAIESPTIEEPPHLEPVATSLCAICAHRLLWGRILGMACVATLVAACARLLPATWSLTILSGITGMSLGAAAVLLGPLVKSGSSCDRSPPGRDAVD